MLATRLPLRTVPIRSKHYQYTKRVACEPAQIYAVVADVASYKEFVPYVVDSFHSVSQVDNRLVGAGGFTVDWSAYKEDFSCDLEYFPPHRIVSSTHGGLFEHLYCEWGFEPVQSKYTRRTESNVSVTLDYQFKSALYNNVSGLFQSKLTEIMIKAFEDRLRQVK